MACRKCIYRAGTMPCAKFDSPHQFCHTCGHREWMHKLRPPAPALRVIEGGKGDDADRYGAWINGEVM